MTDIIDISAAREKRDGPDSDCIYIDQHDGKGTRWFKFIAQFDADGSTFAVELWALDKDDAQRRVGLMRETLRYEGQVYGRIT